MRMNGNVAEKPRGLAKPWNKYIYYADRLRNAEKERVATEVSIEHRKKNGEVASDLKEALKQLTDNENFFKEKMKIVIQEHPTTPWWSKINGAHAIIVGKVIGHIENFGKWYPIGDSLIPSHITRDSVEDEAGKQWVWVNGIERLVTPSKLHKYAGIMPGMRLEAGKLAPFNQELKTMLFRLVQFGFIYNPPNAYIDLYRQYKESKTERWQNEGVRVMPTPRGKYCESCEKDFMDLKTAKFCPECGTQFVLKKESESIRFKGHLDNMAKRRIMKLFADHLWAVWREALKLPVRQPYPIEVLGHTTVINPWDMCNKPDESSQ
jgi:predicted RNA-binding Zn-ribbon protein involved in translation (DUF1610 family)